MDILAEVKHVPSGVEVQLSGGDVAKIDTSRLQSFINSRLSCNIKNGCAPKDSAATKAKCLKNLIDHKYSEPVGKSGTEKTSVIRLEGDAAQLREFATSDRIQRLVQNFFACRSENHCSPAQALVERWHCVNTLAQHILRR